MASPSAELQALIYDRLVADAGVHGYVADRVYDGVPDDAPFPYLSFGATDWLAEDDECVTARRETVRLHVWSRSNRRLRIAKEICDAVKAALHDYAGQLTGNALVSLRVTGGQTMPDPDGLTAHGTVEVEALVEER